MSISRRKVLTAFAGMGGLMLASGANSIANASTQAPLERFAQLGGDFSWQPQKLKLAEVEALGHVAFHHQGYGWAFGVMYAIIGLMGEKFGAPYNTFPFSCMEYGKSSIANSGGTCGALLGASQVISLFYPRKVAIPLQAELLRWFEVTPLPMYTPKKGVGKVDGKFVSNASDSILCHVSVARWCNKSGFTADSTERSERCGRLTADVAKKTAELIFAQMDNKFKSRFAASEIQEGCRIEGCHGGDDSKWAVGNLKGTFECEPCHSGSYATEDKTKLHP